MLYKSQTVREELSEFLLTQSFLLLALMGMFEDEKVVSRWICGNPVGKFVDFCRFSVNQLDGLSVYIQPLQHNIRKQM